MARKLFAVALVFAVAAFARSADDKKLTTKVYDLKPLLGEKGMASGFADTDAVIKLILETIPLGELKPGTDGPQLIERDGGKLEVRATADHHDQIKELLEAVERLADVAVDIKAEVIELDAAAFEKLTKVLPKSFRGKPGSPVVFSTGEEMDEKGPTAEEEKALREVNKILRAGREVQTSNGRFINGTEATVSARQSVLTYKNRPESLVVKEGFRLVGTPVVSADRRFVRFKLTEKSVAVTGMRKRDLGEIGGQKIVAETPELEDLGVTGSAVVADGGSLLFCLAYAPKDKVWVVSLQPTIFIKAEEEEVKKQEK